MGEFERFVGSVVSWVWWASRRVGVSSVGMRMCEVGIGGVRGEL